VEGENFPCEPDEGETMICLGNKAAAQTEAEVAQETKVGGDCVACSCTKWSGENYSDCRPITDENPCNAYCVQCEADGVTAIPGFWTEHGKYCEDETEPVDTWDSSSFVELVSTGKCPDGSGLTEEQCAAADQFGNMYAGSYSMWQETCGCYVNMGNNYKRRFNVEGENFPCEPDEGETMICLGNRAAAQTEAEIARESQVGASNTENRVESVIGETLGLESIHDVHNDDELKKDLGWNYVGDHDELVVAISDEFDLEIPRKEVEKWITVQNVIDYVTSVLGNESALARSNKLLRKQQEALVKALHEITEETQVGATYSSHYNTLKCGDIGKLDVSGGSECASAYTAVTGQSASSTNYGGVQYISGNWAPYGCHMAYTGKSTPWLYWNSQYGDGSGYGSYQTICKTEDPDYGCGPGNPAPSGCDNKCGSTKVNDECGVCGGSGILDGKCDCSGNVVDECGVCGGEGYTNMCTWCDCQKWDEPNYSDCHQVASKADAKRYAVRCEQDGSTPMPSFWTDHDEECKKYSCNL